MPFLGKIMSQKPMAHTSVVEIRTVVGTQFGT
jgi:hypothetical protein